MKTYRVGVIGSTGRGDYGHGLDTPWIGFPQCQLVAVADDNPTGLAVAARRLGVKQAYRDYRQMLEQEQLDIVAICQRWVDRHAEMCLAAAESGAHIYCEKPFCRSLEEADRIVDACQRAHVKLAIAHPTHYSPVLAKIGQLIAGGELGQVLEYRARGKEDRRGGGEDLWVLGSHVLDMIRTLAGHPQWCFAQVKAEGEPITAADVVDGNEGLGPLAGDSVHAMYGLADGSTAYFASRRSAAGQPSRYGLQIYGSAGVIEILEGILAEAWFLPDASWSPGRSGRKWLPITSAGIDEPEPLSGSEYTSRHHLAVTDLLEAIEQQREPLCGAEAGRGIVEMIVAVFESQRQGAPVMLPLENRQHPLAMR